MKGMTQKSSKVSNLTTDCAWPAGEVTSTADEKWLPKSRQPLLKSSRTHLKTLALTFEQHLGTAEYREADLRPSGSNPALLTHG